MSTRYNIELQNASSKTKAILYGPNNGHPAVVLPFLEEQILSASRLFQKKRFALDAIKLASVLIAESIEQDGMPRIYPCLNRYDDIDYLYEVKLDGYDHAFVSCVDLRKGQPTIVVEFSPCDDAAA